MYYKLLNQHQTKKDLIYYYEKTIRLTEHKNRLTENQIKKANKLKLFNSTLDLIKYYLDCYTLDIITE